MQPYYIVSIDRLIADSSRVVRRLQKRSRIPVEVQVTQIAKCDWNDVFLLHSDLFPMDWQRFVNRMTGSTDRIQYCSKLSVVLKHHDVCIGTCIFLPMAEDQSAWLFAVVVLKERRRGWVTPYLKHQAFEMAKEQGLQSVRFQAYNENPDTLNHATRLQATRYDL